MSRDKPRFASKARVLRYINKIHRQNNRRASPPAFFLTDADKSKPDDAFLSVNSTEVETENQIVAYFRKQFQENKDQVAFCSHKIQQYVDAGREFLDIRSNRTSPHWTFKNGQSDVPAFTHRPKHRDSLSHCGVDFVRRLSEHEEKKFARRMASKPTFKLS